jgi:hypothetical protein
MVSVRATTPITLSSQPPVAAAPAAAPTNQPKPSFMPKLDLDLFGYAGAGAVLGGVFHAAKVFSEESDASHTLYKYEPKPGEKYFYRANARYFTNTDRQQTRALPDFIYKAPTLGTSNTSLGFDPQRPLAQLKYKYEPLEQTGWLAGVRNQLNRKKAPDIDSDDLSPKKVILFQENGSMPKQVIEYMKNGTVEVTDKINYTKEVYEQLGAKETHVLTHRYTMGKKGQWDLVEKHLLEETAEGLKVRVIQGANAATQWLKTALPQLDAPLEQPILKATFTDFPIRLPGEAKRIQSYISAPLLRNMFNLQGMARYGIIGGAVAMVAGLLTATATSTKVNLAFNQT